LKYSSAIFSTEARREIVERAFFKRGIEILDLVENEKGIFAKTEPL